MKSLAYALCFLIISASALITVPIEQNSTALYVETAGGFMNRLYVTIAVGTPPQLITVPIDLLHGYLSIPTLNCSYALGEGEVFNNSTSATYNNTSNPNYGGDYGFDTVSIAGLTIDDTIFWLSDSDTSDCGGALGLAYPQQVAYEASFLTQLFQTDLLEDNSFSLYLSEDQSALIFGGIDPALAQSNFTYIPIVGDGVWSFFGNVSISNTPLLSAEIVLNTWERYIAMPSQNFALFTQLTGLNPNGVYGEDILNLLRPIIIQVGKVTITVPSSTYMYCSEGDCTLDVKENSTGNQIWLGQAFLRSYYVHFDYYNLQIGFATPAIL